MSSSARVALYLVLCSIYCGMAMGLLMILMGW